MLFLVLEHLSLLLVIVHCLVNTLILLHDLFVVKFNELLLGLVEFMLLLFVKLLLVNSELFICLL